MCTGTVANKAVLIQMIQETGGRLSSRADKMFSSEEGSPEKVMPESTSPVARTLFRGPEAAVSSAPSRPAGPASLEFRGGGGGASGSGDPLADLLTKQTELLRLALEKKPPKRSTIQVTPKVQWPVLDDECSDLRSVQEFYDQFEATIALANDGEGMSDMETLVTLKACLRQHRLKSYELIYKRHLNDGLLKRDPGAVYSAVKQKHLLFAETREEKELRVLDDWERLHTFRLSAHQREVLWEEKLGEREAVGLGMTARENLIQYLRKIGDQLSREVRKDKRYREGATGAREFRGVATWEEAHEVVKEYEAMNAGQRALQNSSLSVGGPQDANSPGDSADKRKRKKKKGEAEADSSMPLDANAKKKKVCDHESCKHGDRCEYSHEKSLVEAERKKKKKEADKAKGNDGAAASSSKGKGKKDKDKDKDKDKKGKGKGDRKGAKQRFLAEIAKAKGTGVPGVQLATTDGPTGVGATAMACENPFVCFESVPLEGGLQRSVSTPAAADSIVRAQPSPAPKEKNRKKEKAKAGGDVAKEDFNSIDDLPKNWFVDTPNSRGGYQYKTEVEIFGRKVACMLDTCAGCNSVTEEMVVGMIRVGLKAGVRLSSTEFPVAALECWEVPEVVNGLAKDSPLPLKGGVVLRVRLVDKRQGKKSRDILVRAKILGRGSGLILGGRALDSADIELSVVDEIAAICGHRPLEQIADSSGYAVGGVAVQNPPERDELLQQRTKDLQGLIGQLRGFSLEEFLGEEETGKVIPWSLLSDVEAAVEPVDLMTGKKVRPGSLARSDQDPGAGGRWSQCRPTRSVVFRESWLSQGQCLS
ncbi:unnamed protein product [Symbiodinium microadriaticum]|nr:unnamed protein product [Symbiodinium microadriaticum]